MLTEISLNRKGLNGKLAAFLSRLQGGGIHITTQETKLLGYSRSRTLDSILISELLISASWKKKLSGLGKESIVGQRMIALIVTATPHGSNRWLLEP
jgi:hypothetical protein